MTGKPAVVHFVDERFGESFDHAEVLPSGWVLAREDNRLPVYYPPHRIDHVERLESREAEREPVNTYAGP